jgi:N-acetylneuraminate synthase
VKNKIFVIAEAGVNHNGNSKMAFQLVDAAVQAGADAVKFQTFKAENLVTKNIEKAAYQKKATGKTESQYTMLKKLELSIDMHHQLFDYCKKKRIQFLSSPFDVESIDFLVKKVGLNLLKIPSGELTNGPLLLEFARTGCNLIMSTGMATLEEIEQALGVISFGLLGHSDPSILNFQSAYKSISAKNILKEKVSLLHCTTEYPAMVNDINLNAITTMREKFGLETGYSDHSLGITIPVAASALGARIIEKHLTLDTSLSGPDHKASLSPLEFKSMVSSIRDIEEAMGNGEKTPSQAEIKNKDSVRKCLVAGKNITSGEEFTKENIVIKRAGAGKSPMEYWSMIGQASTKKYSIDEII